LAIPVTAVPLAHAVTPTVRLAAPVVSWHSASTQYDGANSTVHLAADVTGLTAGELATVSVRFSAIPSGGVRTTIATDSTAPFSTEWAPSPGTYSVTAETLDSTGAVTATATTSGVTVSATASSVHVTAPGEGSLLGWYRPSGASAGFVSVAGSRSSNAPRVDVSLGTTWNAAAVGTSAAGGTATWALAAPFAPATAPTGDTAGTTVDTWLTAAAVEGGATVSDEAIPVTLYLQRITAATGASSLSGAKNTDVPIAVTVTDQRGRPIVGLPVTGTATGGTTTVTGASTDANGVAQVTARNTAAGTSTVTLQTRYGAAYDATVDRTVTTTLSTYTAVPTSLALASAPAGPVLAATAFDAAAVTATLRDQYGNPMPATAVNAKETVTRTTNGATSVTNYGSGSGLASTTDAQGRLTLARTTSVNASGTDVYDAYLELDGVTGRSAGDIGAPSLTLQWATRLITVDPCTASGCVGQQQVGATTTYTVREALGATPSTGRTLALTITGVGASFPTTQPGTTTRTSATAATCVTDNSGACSFALVDATAETTTVSVADTGPSGTSGAPAAALTVSVRARSVALTAVAAATTTVLDPLGPPAGTAARPGGALVYRATLRDANGLPLGNTHASVSVDHGFLTRNTSDGSTAYGKLTFPSLPLNGVQVALPTSLGTTVDTVSDASGVITVTVALGRDAALDAHGFVSVTPTLAANGGTVSAGAIGTFTTDAARLPSAPAGLRDPLNRDAAQPLTLGEADGKLLTGYVPITQARKVTVFVRDAFGNLARPAGALSLTLTGVGSVASTARVASYLQDLKPIAVTATAAGTGTLTATAALPVTTFSVSGTTVGATATPSSVTATAGPLQWYLPLATTAAGATYQLGRTPLAAAYAVGSSVTFTLKALDQHQQPLKGLAVTVDRTGPASAAPGHFALATDANGGVAYALTGAAQGSVAVQFVATSGGIEVFRSLTAIAFDVRPTIAAPASRVGPGSVLVAGVTRPQATVTLRAKVYGATAYRTIASTTSDGSGRYAFSPSVSRQTRFLVAVDGAVASSVVVVSVSVRPALALTSTGGVLSVHLTTSPVAAHTTVNVYLVGAGGARQLLGTAVTDRKGTFVKGWSIARGRTVTVVVYVRSAVGITGNWSARVTTTVR
jgi:hypothetical protein